MTSKAALPDITDNYILGKISDEDTLELLSNMCKSKKSVTHDLFAIQEAFPNKNKKAKNELDFEHDFFKIINGHPLSISLVSSLKNGKFQDIVLQ